MGAVKRASTWAPRSKVFIKDCKTCGATYVARSGRSVACGDRCRRVYWTMRERARAQVDPSVSAARMRKQRAEWTPKQREHARENSKAWRERGGYWESKRASDQRRRAWKLGAETEKFTTAEIFERDGWCCGICSKPVDPTLAYPDRLSASLDHIVPLSLGGAHTRANTRLAHLWCNVSRGNRVDSN